MIRNRRPKVLLGIPTYDGKNYCLTRFVRGIHALNKDGFQVRVLFVDNTADGGKNAKMIEAVSGYTCHHLDVSHFKTTNEKLAESHNYLRRAAMNMGADYLFHVESDLLLHPMTLHELYLMDTPLATSLYSIHSAGHRTPLFALLTDATPRSITPFLIDTQPLEAYHHALKKPKGTSMGVGVGVMLMSKNVVKDVPFKADPSAQSAPDSFWSADAARLGYFPKYNLRVFAHHMNDLGWNIDHYFSSTKFAQESYKSINYED